MLKKYWASTSTSIAAVAQQAWQHEKLQTAAASVAAATQKVGAVAGGVCFYRYPYRYLYLLLLLLLLLLHCPPARPLPHHSPSFDAPSCLRRVMLSLDMLA
jgi:hypothetical protein